MGETKTSFSLVKIAWKVPLATEFCLTNVEKLWLNITIGGVEWCFSLLALENPIVEAFLVP